MLKPIIHLVRAKETHIRKNLEKPKLIAPLHNPENNEELSPEVDCNVYIRMRRRDVAENADIELVQHHEGKATLGASPFPGPGPSKAKAN